MVQKTNTIVIGNKPFKKIILSDILDSFEDICRCNMSLPNKNNGTKYGTLGLCIHLYDNLIKNKLPKQKFIDFYKTEYREEEIIKFIDNFDPKKFNRVYYAMDRVNLYNNLLSNLGCPYKFTLQPRTGYTIMFENLLSGKNVFISNFSIVDEDRVSYYLKESTGYESECHSKTDELNIVKWLHNNDKIDATLCMLTDSETPTLICDEFDPKKNTIERLINNFGMCILEEIKNTSLISNFSDLYNIEKNTNKTYTLKKLKINEVK